MHGKLGREKREVPSPVGARFGCVVVHRISHRVLRRVGAGRVCPGDSTGGSDEIVASEGNIPVRIVGGRLVAAVELSTIHSRVPVNLFIDYESPSGLQLHDAVAKPLRTEDDFGQTAPITIHLPDFDITVDRREKGPEDEYGEFTRLHSEELNEDALVGSIGARIFSKYRVTFNLHEGRIELALPGKEVADGEDEEVTNTEEKEPGDEKLEVGITVTDDVVWLPIQLASGKIHAMAVSTTSYDSLIDREWCDIQGFPAGEIDPLKLGELNLAKFVAFRPQEVAYSDPAEAIGVLGLNLLKHLHLTIDRSNKTAVCYVVSPPNFPVADREYFEAGGLRRCYQLEAWLDKYPKERLSAEGAEKLLTDRLVDKATPEQIESAIRRLRVTWPDDMISTKALDLVKELLKTGYPEQAVFAGELGIEGGRTDRYPESVHQLHATLGELFLGQDENKRAWRHLLSAAFGVPDDGRVNLNLGRFYEKEKRYNRALSRYVQAVTKVETGEQALEGLARVQRKMGDAAPLSVDTIAPLIAGKTYNYAAATRYRPTPEEETNRVVLVEFFTNAHYKKPGKEEGAIGGALGNEGIMTYFPREKVAMLTYHLLHPELRPDSLANEFAEQTARFYGASPAVQLVNGTGFFAGEGRPENAEEIFLEGRKLIRPSLAEKSRYKLELTGAVQDGDLTGSLKVTDLSPTDGTPTVPTIQIVLAERRVLYPSLSKIIIQNMVARAALTERSEGIEFKPTDGQMVVPFSRSLDEIVMENTGYLKSRAGGGQLFAAKMDPRQLTMVAFVRDGASKKILQAIQIDPTLPEEPAAAE